MNYWVNKKTTISVQYIMSLTICIINMTHNSTHLILIHCSFSKKLLTENEFWIYAHIYVYIWVYRYTYIHAHIYMHIYVYMCTSIYTYIFIYMCVYTYENPQQKCAECLLCAKYYDCTWKNSYSEWIPHVKGDSFINICLKWIQQKH